MTLMFFVHKYLCIHTFETKNVTIIKQTHSNDVKIDFDLCTPIITALQQVHEQRDFQYQEKLL